MRAGLALLGGLPGSLVALIPALALIQTPQALAQTVPAQTAPPFPQINDPRTLLLHVRDNVTDTLARLPRYLCSLTIDRAQYTPPGDRPATCDGLTAQQAKQPSAWQLWETDRVRLDVAVSASGATSNEMYSWTGADRFNDHDVFNLVRAGALQNGSFSNFLASIFKGDAATFSYNGGSQLDGRTLAQFGFAVPRERSNYTLGSRQGGGQMIAGYEGSFFVDPDTGALVRVLIRTTPPTSDAGVCQASTTLDYSQVRMNDTEFLLPTEVHLDILNADGGEFRNSTAYASCHEFVGKSVLKFDDPPPQTELNLQAKASAPMPLPPGLDLDVLFAQSIDPKSAAAGDLVKVQLKSALRDASSKVELAPAGAEIAARIVRLEQFEGPPSSVRILLRLETINVRGTPLPLNASMSSLAVKSPGSRVQLGSLDQLANLGVGEFEFPGVSPNFVIPRGLESKWVTFVP